jgi:hypothetical protein
MKQAAPAVRELASRLLARETIESDPVGLAHAAEHALGKLRRHLVSLIGVAGYKALLSRALDLGKTEADLLGALRIEADASLEGFVEAARTRQADEIKKAGTALLAYLIGLLIVFIGEDLALRLVREAWSDAPGDASRSSVEKVSE